MVKKSDLIEPHPPPKTIEDIDFTGIDRIAAQLKAKITPDDIEFIQNSINFVLEKNKNKKG